MSTRQDWGGEAEDSVLDGVIQTTGTVTYGTSPLPPNSPSTVSMRGSPNHLFYRSWTVGDGTWQPSGTTYWMHSRIRHNTTTATDSSFFMGTARGTLLQIGWSLENSTGIPTIQVTDGVNPTVRATASPTDAISVDTYERFHLFVDHQAGGQVRLYKDGDVANPIATYTLTAGDITNLGGLPDGYGKKGRSNGGALDYFDDIFMMDPEDGIGVVSEFAIAEAGVFGYEASADTALGAGNNQMTGGFAEVDVPPNLATFLEATAVNQLETLVFPDSTDARVYSVSTRARVTRTGTTAGSNMRFVQDDGTNQVQTTDMVAPGDGTTAHEFPTAPDAGAWTTAKFNATEFGVESRT